VRESRDQQPRRRKLTLRDGTRGRAVLALLAEHPGGLSTPRCAELNDGQSGQRELTWTGAVLRAAEAAGWVRRAGKTPGRWRQGPAVIWAITGAGREALAQAARPRPEPQLAPTREQPRPPEHPWADDAEKRTRAGESVASIARRHRVDRKTVERALDRRGVPHGSASRPGWADDATTRYEAGEPAGALARRYGVSHSKVTNELRKQGVQIRTPKQASQAKQAWQASQEPLEQPGSEFVPVPQK
jgi:transposase-like protein